MFEGVLGKYIQSINDRNEGLRSARRTRQAKQAAAMQQQAILGAMGGGGGGGMPGGDTGYMPSGGVQGSGATNAAKTVRNILGHSIGLAPISYGKGKSTLINAQYAGAFQGLLNELQRAGYNIDVGLGYQNRNVAGTNTASKHSGGYAIDINPSRNPFTTKLGSTEFNPSVINRILQQYPMIEWGGNWSGPRKDYMHFSIKQRIPGYSGL